MFYLSFLSVSLPASYTEDYRIYLDLNGDKKEIICKVLPYAKINNKKNKNGMVRPWSTDLFSLQFFPQISSTSLQI